MTTYNIVRTEPPRWMHDGQHLAEDAVEDMYDFTGEQAEWGYAIPDVYRLLAAPGAGLSFPRRPSEPGHEVALTYWASLLQLLVYSCGWSRPDRGLRWWYDDGFPTADPRLALIDQLWRADGQLDWFAAWLWTQQMYADYALTEVTGHEIDRTPLAIDERWIEARTAEAEQSGVANPAPSGGWDPLHLSMHCHGPLDELRTAPLLFHSDKDRRQAVLVLDSMRGWYRALAEHGPKLPSVGERSWRIEVVAKPVGHLGTFRRSRQTGLWFAGKHSIHVRGV